MMDVLTEHLDIWTSAQVTKSNGGRGRGKNGNGQSICGIKKLRELILELAVRGKLVPQDPNDEPASVLLEKIAEEKQQLVKKGKIKKQRKLPQVLKDQQLLLLPHGWTWCNLQDLFTLITDGDHQAPPKSADGIPFLVIGNLNSGNISFSNCKYVPVNYYENLDWARKPTQGDLLYTVTGSYGIPIHVNSNSPFCVQRHIAILKSTSSTPEKYLSQILSSTYAFDYASRIATGIAQKTVPLTGLRKMAIPIPPLAEQHRIVAKVEELMALCDKLEEQQLDHNATHQTLVETLLSALTNGADQAEFEDTWQRIAAHFDTLFTTVESIDYLKQTILQLAVMGKLVPQDPDDEPASVLLEKIAEEKARLVKEGKIKKQKKLPKVNETNTPFPLPKGWAWARFPELGEFGRGKSKHRPRNDPSLYAEGNIPMIQTGDVARSHGNIHTFSAQYNEKGLSQSKLWPSGTMCITIAANIADSGILSFDACFPDSVVGLTPSSLLNDAKYFEYFMRTAKERLLEFAPSTAQKNINLTILQTVLIPLPPNNELTKIVSKVDQLMALCDNLKEQLTAAQTTQLQLADTIVQTATN